MPLVMRLAGLGKVPSVDKDGPSSCHCVRPLKWKARADQQLALKVDQLYVELAEVRSLLHERGPVTAAGEAWSSTLPMQVLVPEGNVLSLVASTSHFQADEGGWVSVITEPGSLSTARSLSSKVADGSMQASSLGASAAGCSAVGSIRSI